MFCKNCGCDMGTGNECPQCGYLEPRKEKNKKHFRLNDDKTPLQHVVDTILILAFFGGIVLCVIGMIGFADYRNFDLGKLISQYFSARGHLSDPERAAVSRIVIGASCTVISLIVMFSSGLHHAISKRRK